MITSPVLESSAITRISKIACMFASRHSAMVFSSCRARLICDWQSQDNKISSSLERPTMKSMTNREGQYGSGHLREVPRGHTITLYKRQQLEASGNNESPKGPRKPLQPWESRSIAQVIFPTTPTTRKARPLCVEFSILRLQTESATCHFVVMIGIGVGLKEICCTPH